MKACIFSFLILFSVHAFAQFGQPEFVDVLSDKDQINAWPFCKLRGDTLSHASFIATYQLTYKIAPMDASTRSTKAILLISSKWTHFYNALYNRADSIYTDSFRSENSFHATPPVPWITVGEVYRNHSTDSMFILTRMPFTNKYILQYDEKEPDIKWEMEDKTDMINGYACFKAIADYGGRTWTAWYTPEIPVNAGPWKLWGLPGLIMKVTDTTDDYTFEVIQLTRQKVPIIWYDLPYKQISKKEMMRQERGFHSMPIVYFGEYGKHAFFARGSSEQLGPTWSIKYNPIEQE